MSLFLVYSKDCDANEAILVEASTEQQALTIAAFETARIVSNPDHYVFEYYYLATPDSFIGKFLSHNCCRIDDDFRARVNEYFEHRLDWAEILLNFCEFEWTKEEDDTTIFEFPMDMLVYMILNDDYHDFVVKPIKPITDAICQ
jgi:hypothetical protein